MPDWPGIANEIPHGNLSTIGVNSMAGVTSVLSALAMGASSVWPAANRAIYVPVQVDVPVAVLKMSFFVATQSGNYDIGIYDEHGNRLVSKGSTAVPVGGVATADITDTVLMPGVYFLALNIDNVTASVARWALAATNCQMCGIQQQAVGAVTLPDPAVFANPASAYFPLIVATVVTTI